MKLQELKSKSLRIFKQNFKWIIAIIMLITCFGIAKQLFDNEIYVFDNFIYKYISIIISPKMTLFFKLMTELGSSTAIILICIGSFVFIKNKIYAKLMALNLVIVTLLNLLIKNIVSRPRPTGFRLIDESGYSFPSGHSMASMAFYGFIIYLVFKFVKNKYVKWTLICLLSLLIVLIGVSRIYLGVHYASDVIAGFSISVFYLILVESILSRNKILIK